ncbi:MAG: phenylacetate--CoA ligase family protein [Alphaproteobacteria bacterium]|nr:phenylacetate--CoA ligase family protein [Alphaproteobacteria bacterium]
MSGYFEEARIAELMRAYPIGQAYLDDTARLSRDELRQVQEKRFAEVMARAWQVPFYRRRWSAEGIEPGDIRGLDDIEKLPPFSKADLMASIGVAPPLGDYHGIESLGDGERPSVVLHTTSGTTGAPQPLFFGAWDREVQNLLLARAYRLQGLRDDDIAHAVYGFGMVNGGHYIREAILHFTKALFLPAGTGLETPSVQQVQLIQRFGATVLLGFVDYIKRLASVAKEQGIDPAELDVRMISGQIGQDDRDEVSAMWGGADVFDWYGVGDTGIIATEGPDKDGLHLFEDAHFVELLDPETDQPVAAGHPGNICVTCLFKTTVYPIIRYDTKDVTTELAGPSDLGQRRIAGFQGRSDNMVKLRGVNVYPTAIGAHLQEHGDALGEYICRVDRKGDREEMTVIVEVRTDALGRSEVKRELATLLRQKLGVEVGVETVGAGETADLTQIDSRQKPIRLLSL